MDEEVQCSKCKKFYPKNMMVWLLEEDDINREEALCYKCYREAD